MKKRTLSVLLVVVFAWMTLAIASVLAQSTNERNPTPLNSTTINGAFNNSGGGVLETYYYSFTAGPGRVTVDLSHTPREMGTNFILSFAGARCCSGDAYSSIVNAEAGVSHQNKISFNVSSQQRLTMSITGGGKFSYRISLSGAVSIETPEVIAETVDEGIDLNGSADERNPTLITSKTIRGRVSSPLGDYRSVFYKIVANKGTVTVDLTAVARDGMNFSLFVKGSKVDQSIGPLASGGNDKMKGKLTFKVSRRQTLRIQIYYSGNAVYTIKFGGSVVTTK